MNSKNMVKDALFLLLLRLNLSFLQIVAEIDVPQLQLLASNLQSEECVKLVFLDSHSQLSDSQIKKLAREQSCFRRLVKWICQLRTVTRNTHQVVNNCLERIGRDDLVACLAEFNTKSSKPPKVVRNVHAADDSEDYEGPTTSVSSVIPQQPQQDSKITKTPNGYSNQTIAKIIGQTTIKVSLQTGGIILASTILITCCCTLFIRNRCAKLFNKMRGKKKKSKFIPFDMEDVSKSYYVRKPRVKRKRASSYEMVHTATQNNTITVPQEPEELTPTGCYKCYKKKRKKSSRRPYR